MLGKLLKYEVPALGRRLLPLYAGWIFTAAILGVFVGPLAERSDFMTVISVLLYTAAATAVMVMAVVTIIQRYNTSLLGDEGYFNHVLPVRASAHIASKAIASMIWVVLAFVAMLLTILIIALFGGNLKELLSVDWALMFRSIDWLTMLLILVVCVMSLVKSIMGIYTALTLGHQAREHTVLACIGSYFLVMIFETVVARLSLPFLAKNFDTFDTSGEFRLMLLVGLAVTLLLCAVYFFICKFLMEKHLNLS